MQRGLIKRIILWAPAILWMALIFKLSNGRVPMASPVYWEDFAVKKSAHVIFYGILTLLTYRSLRGEGLNRKKAIIWAIAISTFYGMTDEYHQSFTQGREARVRDVGFDGFGSTIFALIYYYLLPKLPKEAKLFLGRMGFS